METNTERELLKKIQELHEELYDYYNQYEELMSTKKQQQPNKE